MPIGVVTDEEFESELADIPVSNDRDVKIVDIKKGRGEGKKEVPSSLRKVIAQEAIESGNDSAKELARAFDISDSSVSAYKNGATSTASYHEPNENLNDHVNGVKLTITNGARGKILAALKHITEEKLEKAKLRDVSTVAKDMSSLIRNLEPQADKNDKGNNVQFVLFSPQLKKEESYEVIDVND